MSVHKEYAIDSIEDILAIPDDKIDSFLVDLRDWIAFRKEFSAMLNGFDDNVKSSIKSHGMRWVDDGVQGISGVEIVSDIKVKGKDGK